MIRLMTANEAVAQGALEAGVTYAAAYPGTPSTEILENLTDHKDKIIAEWAPNEKVALECAMGAAIAGARALSTMKMVGVNVAADPLFSIAYSGINGGLVLVSADDPGLHSSQNEQDNRFYAPFAKVPMFEPSDSQESLDMIKAAFDCSEAFEVPVLFRMTTRVCHSKSLVKVGEPVAPTRKPYTKNLAKYDLMPAVSRRLRAELEVKLKKLAEYSETSPFNFTEMNDTKIGIITSGAGYQYAREVFGKTASYLKLGFTFPLPEKKIREFAAKVGTLYIVEELEPYLENQIKQMGISCIGKEKIPNMYELNPDIVAKALLGKSNELIQVEPGKVAPRPPLLCAGCPHRGFFVELGKAAKRNKLMLVGDIGCYGLGGSSPLEGKDLCIDMGSSTSIAHGAQKVFDKFEDDTRAVATFGDSTFFHSGINAVLNVVYNKSNAVICILDNRITGMTGQQENPGSGATLQGDITTEVNIEAVVKALGINQVRVINPQKLQDVRNALKWALGLKEPSVIITRWPCVLKKLTKEERDQYAHKNKQMKVDEAMCNGCRVCLNIGCPALSFDKMSEKAVISEQSCVGCEVCAQVCGYDAIVKGELENA